jgi:hypothetical protein
VVGGRVLIASTDAGILASNKFHGIITVRSAARL